MGRTASSIISESTQPEKVYLNWASVSMCLIVTPWSYVVCLGCKVVCILVAGRFTPGEELPLDVQGDSEHRGEEKN
jgi:hypothetical protein